MRQQLQDIDFRLMSLNNSGQKPLNVKSFAQNKLGQSGAVIISQKERKQHKQQHLSPQRQETGYKSLNSQLQSLQKHSNSYSLHQQFTKDLQI